MFVHVYVAFVYTDAIKFNILKNTNQQQFLFLFFFFLFFFYSDERERSLKKRRKVEETERKMYSNTYP